MDKNDKVIMVVKREVLLGNDYFEGFRPANGVDYKSRILEKFEWKERNCIENNDRYKQPIGYSTIVNPILKRIFAYQRSFADKEYTEKRLQGKWSWGIGGHIEKRDIKVNKNPLYASTLREIEEEVGIKNPDLKLLGYINNDTDEVGKVHFGLVYVVETSEVIEPRDSEIKKGGWKTIEELKEFCQSSEFTVEEWSKILINPLELYFKRISK